MPLSLKIALVEQGKNKKMFIKMLGLVLRLQQNVDLHRQSFSTLQVTFCLLQREGFHSFMHASVYAARTADPSTSMPQGVLLFRKLVRFFGRSSNGLKLKLLV